MVCSAVVLYELRINGPHSGLLAVHGLCHSIYQQVGAVDYILSKLALLSLPFNETCTNNYFQLDSENVYHRPFAFRTLFLWADIYIMSANIVFCYSSVPAPFEFFCLAFISEFEQDRCSFRSAAVTVALYFSEDIDWPLIRSMLSYK